MTRVYCTYMISSQSATNQRSAEICKKMVCALQTYLKKPNVTCYNIASVFDASIKRRPSVLPFIKPRKLVLETTKNAISSEIQQSVEEVDEDGNENSNDSDSTISNDDEQNQKKIENFKRTRTRSAANNSSNQYVLKRMTYQEEDSDSSKSNKNSDIASNDEEPNFNEKDEEEVKNSEQKSVTRFMSNNLFDFNLNTPSTKFKSLMLASRLSEKRNFVETQPLRNDSSTEDNQQAESQEDENDQSKRLCSFGRNAKVTPQMMNSNITPKASTINTGNTTKETSSETRSTTDHSLFLVTNINNQESSPT